MEDQGGLITAKILAFTSAFFAWFAFITIADFQIGFTLIATAVAVVSGVFAARYYYYAAQEKKQNLKK